MPHFAVMTTVGCIIEAETEEAAKALGQAWAVAMNQQSFGVLAPNSIPPGFERPIYGTDHIKTTDATETLAKFEAMGRKYLREGETSSSVSVSEIWGRMQETNE